MPDVELVKNRYYKSTIDKLFNNICMKCEPR